MHENKGTVGEEERKEKSVSRLVYNRFTRERKEGCGLLNSILLLRLR